MELLSDVERLMAARMAVRSEARGSGGAMAKVAEKVYTCWSRPAGARYSTVPFVKRPSPSFLASPFKTRGPY